MGIFSRLTGEKMRDAAAEAGLDRKTGGITYDPGLIDQLKQEHRELVDALAAIKMASAACRFRELPELLAAFKGIFQSHILVENVKLYGYVQQRYALDSDTADFVFELRKDMHGIARTLVKFVNTHTANVPTFETLATFRAELDLIGSLLLRRVHLEENRLYLLYQPA